MKQPHCFLECAAGLCCGAKGAKMKTAKKCGLTLRTEAITKASKKAIAAAPTKVAAQRLKTEKGISTMHHAMSSAFIPGFNEHQGVPFVRRRPCP